MFESILAVPLGGRPLEGASAMYHVKKRMYSGSQEVLFQCALRAHTPSLGVVNAGSRYAQYLLAGSFVLDLHCLSGLKLKKNLVKRAFRKNFCREFTKGGGIGTVRLGLGCASAARAGPGAGPVAARGAGWPPQAPRGPRSRLCGGAEGDKGAGAKKARGSGAGGEAPGGTKGESRGAFQHFKEAKPLQSLKPHLRRDHRASPAPGARGAAKDGALEGRGEGPPPGCVHRQREQGRDWARYSCWEHGEPLGGHLMSAGWVLSTLAELFSEKKSLRPAVNLLMNDIRTLIDRRGSGCPVAGVRIAMSGRLGSRKKAMAQRAVRSVGGVPLSTFRQRIDYGQGILQTRFGLVGIKVWVSYAPAGARRPSPA